MNQNQTESKPPSVEELRDEGLDETPCCASSDTPQTDKMIHKWNCEATHPVKRVIDAVAYAQKLERALRKFMAVTETGDDGITQMATIEGRVKFYERPRTVRAEAHGILSHNA